MPQFHARISHFDDAALYGSTWAVAPLMVCSGSVGWLLDRRARRWHPDRIPTVLRTWWWVQALVLVPSQFVFAALIMATFSLVRPRHDWGEGVLAYLALSGAYLVTAALPQSVPAWLMVRRRAVLRLPRLSPR